MSQPIAPTQDSFFKKHHFLIRRLHSLSGIVPVGLFVCMHLFTNAQMIWGNDGSAFQHEVEFIHSMPALFFIEVGLWSSIGFHAVLGVFYMAGWLPNNIRYDYQDNWRYTLQRVTAWIAIVFIFLHIATLRWRWDIFGWYTPFYSELGMPGGQEEPMSMLLTAHALQYHWAVLVLYIVGVLAVVYHWSNGLWTAAISWGITLTVAGQKRWGKVCLGLGVALTLFSAAGIYSAYTFDMENDSTPQQRQLLEKLLIDKKPMSSHHG